MAPTLSRSIESVLNQSHPNFELIVIDDGSTDETSNVIQSFSDPRIVEVTNHDNIGLIATLNKGIEISKGEFIARIDGDDVWTDRDKLSKQVSFFNTHPEHVLLGTQAMFKNGDRESRTHYPISDSDIRKSILSKNSFIHSTIMTRKECLPDSPYRKEDYLLEDYSLWLRLGLVGKFANLPDYSIEYLVNPQGETQKNTLKQSINSLRLIRTYKKKYPRYWLGHSLWLVKICIRKILLHLK